jgi:hypothetical protein
VAEERTVDVDPPMRVQVRDIGGSWRDAWLIAWHRDSAGYWLARVVEVRPAGEVRQPRTGAAANRPDGHPLHRRLGWYAP